MPQEVLLIFDKLAEWFLQDPLQNLLLFFGGSGLLAAVFKWVAIWTDRRQIRARVLSEHYEIKAEPNCLVLLRFEVTNIGEKATSLERTVHVRALDPKAKSESFALQIQETDLQLPPHSPRVFQASASLSATYVFCWFKRYKFSVLRGSGAVVRFRHAENINIGFWTYWFGYIKLRFFWRV